MLRWIGGVSLACLLGLSGLYACGGEEFTATSQAGGAGGEGGGTGGSEGGAGGQGGATDGGGGSGGMPPQCFDDDMDGVTDCEGDCNDDDPDIYPGNIELCGNGIDNDCDDVADQAAACPGGLGTYVSSIIGNDANDGTQTSPVATIAEGIAHALTLGNGQPVFVATGVYGKVVLEDNVSLYGGYQCEDVGNCTWVRDIAVNISEIKNVDDEGVLADIFVTNTTRVDGFTITGLSSASPPSNSQTRAISLLGGTPIISNNKITGGNWPCGTCDSRAIWMQGPANDPITGVLIEDNEITSGNSGRNCAAVQHSAIGAPRVQLHRNKIKGGACPRNRAVNFFGASYGTEIFDNEIFAGTCSRANDYDASFAVIVSGYADVDGNRINHDHSQTGDCELMGANNMWCGGIELAGLTGAVTNNLVHGMPATHNSVGIFLGEGEQGIGLVKVNGNTVDGGGADAGNTLIANNSAAMACITGQGTNAVVGQIRNNILLGGTGTDRFGFFESDQNNSRTCEPIAYENNDIFFAGTLTGNEFIHRHFDGSVGSTLTLTELNMQSYASGNFDTDPQLDMSSYPHLLSGSPCIDAGVDTDAPAVDIDDEARPQGAAIDVGADEAG